MDWHTLSPQAVYFSGIDDEFFGQVFIMIYRRPHEDFNGSVCFSQHGMSNHTRLATDSKSRFHGAIENLKRSHRKSNIRRCLAVTLLEAFARYEHKGSWDETNAGELASKMKLVKTKTPEEMGNLLFSLGILDESLHLPDIVDVVYENNPESTAILSRLGQKLDRLFDPLGEYSPEATEIVYKPPSTGIAVKDTAEVSAICDELVSLQTSFTSMLVNFLQSFVIPLRVKVQNKEIQCSTSAFNSVFPPTIDEVTRINCIFLDSLKTSRDFGSLEVVKSCGAMIPYFYKACMRHEAATKGFSEKLSGLMETVEDVPGGHSTRSIDVIMNGSSLHLSRLKLVLSRLVTTKEWTTDEKQIVETCYNSALTTINSFGKDKLRPYHNRIFTPTGKILTELAQNWPASLQYNWRNRRVVSVFSAKDVALGCEVIVIIFSDVVVLTRVVGDSKQSQPPLHTPCLPDILMHSLINEVSLPEILPEMETVCWMDVTKASMRIQGKMLLVQCGDDALLLETTDVKEKIDQLSKAKILHKACPLQVLKSDTTYWVALDSATLSQKASTSRFCVFLNRDFDQHTLEVYGYTVGVSILMTDEPVVYRLHLRNVLGSTCDLEISDDKLSEALGNSLARMDSGVVTRATNGMVAGNQCILRALNAAVGTSQGRHKVKKDNSKQQLLIVPLPVERSETPWSLSSILKKFKEKKKARKYYPPADTEHEEKVLHKSQRTLPPAGQLKQEVTETKGKDLESCLSTITPNSSCKLNKHFHFPQEEGIPGSEGELDNLTLECDPAYAENEENWYLIENEPGRKNIETTAKRQTSFRNERERNPVTLEVKKSKPSDDRPIIEQQPSLSNPVQPVSTVLPSTCEDKTYLSDLSYYSPSPTVQALDAAPALVNDDSFDYLGNVLNGDIILRENSDIDQSVMQIDSGNERLFDLYYQRKLKESSARYISSLIRSGNSIPGSMNEYE